jgi:hypothetical protein
MTNREYVYNSIEDKQKGLLRGLFLFKPRIKGVGIDRVSID